ncbi:MAG: hypothetical protein P4L85_19580 [Paludisphaera borealis]|uniref:hypothetical protein n=1 Tax=Paludisphaera borealis TaxID=1387353 RepID=UPI002840D6A7|nr:hypothetical protein [Paludisphaera borealis]MDR3621562.1 hypothetical protein [Paludisphaera borealis]
MRRQVPVPAPHLFRHVAEHVVDDPLVDAGRRQAAKRLAPLPGTPRWTADRAGGAITLEGEGSRNLHRRNLKPGQLAAIALDVKARLNEEYEERRLANLKRGDEKPCSRVDNLVNSGNARTEAAAMMGVSQGYVSDAERIHKASPELFDEVKRGRLIASWPSINLTPSLPPTERPPKTVRSSWPATGTA